METLEQKRIDALVQRLLEEIKKTEIAGRNNVVFHKEFYEKK